MTFLCFFFNDTATTEIYTLSLHDALPILPLLQERPMGDVRGDEMADRSVPLQFPAEVLVIAGRRMEPEIAVSQADNCHAHRQRDRKSTTSELQSRQYLVCRLLLEKKTTPL